jgi:hypothetical protein
LGGLVGAIEPVRKEIDLGNIESPFGIFVQTLLKATLFWFDIVTLTKHACAFLGGRSVSVGVGVRGSGENKP